jgi:hypothetical protein
MVEALARESYRARRLEDELLTDLLLELFGPRPEFLAPADIALPSD